VKFYGGLFLIPLFITDAGYRGLPKKGGAGGKGTWGAITDQTPVEAIDARDLDFVSDEVCSFATNKIPSGFLNFNNA